MSSGRPVIIRRIVDRAVRFLTDPIGVFAPAEVTNLKRLKSRVLPGDVLLISGNARISTVVKVLTTSQWSHVVLYVGDLRRLLSADEREEWTAAYGDRALAHLVIDADPIRGVHLRPLDEYVGLMVRHCRPEALESADRERVIDRAISQLGREYDLRHIVRLLIFFAIPWEIFPIRLRKFFTEFTLSESDRICSRVLSEAFHSVGYPIRPLEVIQNRSSANSRAIELLSGMRTRGRSVARLLFGGRVGAAVHRLAGEHYIALRLQTPRYITPADYDLSRFFSVLKDEGDLSINYRSAERLAPEVPEE